MAGSPARSRAPRRSKGSATLTIDASRTTMNCAKQSSARAIQRRRSNSWAVVIIFRPPVVRDPYVCDNRKLSSGFDTSTIRNLGSGCVLVVTQPTTPATETRMAASPTKIRVRGPGAGRASPARRRAPQSRADPRCRPLAVRHQWPRRADRRHRPRGGRRRGHGLPALPDQGGAAPGPCSRPLHPTRRMGTRGARRLRMAGRAFAPSCAVRRSWARTIACSPRRWPSGRPSRAPSPRRTS